VTLVITQNEIYGGFSCPQAALDRESLELVVVEHARQSLQRFIQCYDGRVELRSGGLGSVFRNWMQSDGTFECVWNPAFGEAFAAVFRNVSGDIERRAAMLALRLHEFGNAGEWELAFSQPIRLRFNRWLLPPSDAIAVSATPEAVTLNTRSGNTWRKIAFHYSENAWGTNGDVDSLPVLTRPGIRLTILNAESLTPSSTDLLKTEVLGYGDADVDMQPELLLSRCDTSLSLITEFANSYLLWVGNVIRELVPLRPRQGIFNNGSIDLAPGVICLSNSISNRDNPWSLAEVLVHEATHQYLYIARRLGSMDDGKDDALYFSPFRNTGRPIFNILITYHAFANVVLFYRTALANGLSTDPTFAPAVEERVKELTQKLEALEQALQATKSLTPLGFGLWEPLREELLKGQAGGHNQFPTKEDKNAAVKDSVGQATAM
jgi:hypothetical protein